ncbi:MAG: hypothetical protein IIA60_07170 [Candidatus Marinimicrobia bacterium]|nr:hypothetical protein [Candidatus Neomarinimicrobiota bacterium]
MKTFMDTLAENLKAFTSSAVEKAGELTKAAAGRAEILSRIGRLKMDVFQLHRQQNRVFADLGRIAFNELQSGNIEEFPGRENVQSLREKITGLDQAIADKERAIGQASKMADGSPAKAAKGKSKAAGNGTAKGGRPRSKASGRGSKSTGKAAEK